MDQEEFNRKAKELQELIHSHMESRPNIEWKFHSTLDSFEFFLLKTKPIEVTEITSIEISGTCILTSPCIHQVNGKFGDRFVSTKMSGDEIARLLRILPESVKVKKPNEDFDRYFQPTYHNYEPLMRSVENRCPIRFENLRIQYPNSK